MKFRNLWVWFVLLFAVTVLECRANVVLSPSDGLSRTTNYGPLYTWDGPPGITGYDYQFDTNGYLYGGYDGRFATGTDVDSLLAYDLGGLHGAFPDTATLRMRIDSALCNFSPFLPFNVDVNVYILGCKTGMLDESSYSSPVYLQTWFSVPAGDYGGSFEVELDVTTALLKLMQAGDDQALVLLETHARTTTGPSYLSFWNSPTLCVATSDFQVEAVPEPASILLMGLASLGGILRLTSREKACDGFRGDGKIGSRGLIRS